MHIRLKTAASHHPSGMILTVAFMTSFLPATKQNLVGSIAIPTTPTAMTLTTTTVVPSVTAPSTIVEATRWIPTFQTPTPTACPSSATPRAAVHSLEASMLRAATITLSKTCPIRIAIAIPFRILPVLSRSSLVLLPLPLPLPLLLLLRCRFPPTMRFLSGSSAA